MAESLSEVSSSMEGLEVTEEGKKKSKFKAFKSFFGKKKKKEPEEVPEGAVLKPRFSSSSVNVSSLQPVLEMQVMEHKPKSAMGVKAISHDSIFCSDPEPEKAPSKQHSSPEPQRSRSLKRSPISRTLPRVTESSALGALSGSGGHYSSSSGVWALGFKFTEIQSLRPRTLSTSPLIIRSEKISQDLEKLFTGDRTPKISRRRSSHHSSTPRKSFSELSSDPELSQSSESSTQQPSGFSTPATSQGCLDSSAAKYKIALNPRKQKKSSLTSAKVKQEEQLHSVLPKEKTITKTKQAEQKEQRQDNSPGISSQEQSYKTETQDKTVDETLSSDVASSYSILGLNPRRRRRRAKNEWGIIERGLLKSTQGYGLSTKAKSPANEEMAGGEHSFLQLMLEKKGTGKPRTTEPTSLQEMPLDKGDVERELTDTDVDAQRMPVPQCASTVVAESVISGPPPCREYGRPEGKKKKDKAAVLSLIRKSTSEEEAQVHMHPSQVCGEEEASSSALQTFQPQMELSLESTICHKERHPRSGPRTFSTSVSSATAEDEASMQITPLPLRRWPNAGEMSSDSKSTSEYESSSEIQLSPAQSLQPTWKPKDAGTATAVVAAVTAAAAADRDDDDDDDDDEYYDDDDKDEEEDDDEDDDVFLKSENIDVGLSKMERQQPLRYSSQSLGKPKATEASLKLDCSSEDRRSCEEMRSAQSSQSLEEFEECSESRSFTRGSISEEQQAPRCHSQALQKLEEKEVSTESSRYIEKYHSSKDLRSSEEEQQEVSPVSKNSLKQWNVPSKPVHPIHTAPSIVSSTTQQQPPIMVNISVGPNKSVEPLPPSCAVKSWVSPRSEHQGFAEPEGVASDWDIFMQPVSPRKSLEGYYVEQNVPSSSDTGTMKEGASMETVLLRHHSQPPTRPRLEQEVSAGPELTVLEESPAAQASGCPPQPSVRPSIKKEILLGAESEAFEGSASLDSPPPQHHSQPLLKPLIQQQASAFERGVSMDPKLPTQFQPWMNPQGKQSFPSIPESTVFEGSSSTEHMTLTHSQPMLQSFQEVPLESETVAAKMISMGQLPPKYSAHPLSSHQSQPVSESTSVEGTILVDLLPPQPSGKPKFQPLMTQDPVSTSTQWGSPMEPTSAKHIFQTQANPKFKSVSVSSDSPEVQGNMSMQLVPPRCPPQPWLTPTFEQISVPPGSVSAAWAIPIYSPAPSVPPQPLMGSVVKQAGPRGSLNPSVQQIITVESTPSRYSVQPWQGTPFEQVSVPPDHAAAATASWSIPIDPLAPRIPSQPLVGPVVKTPTSTELVSVSGPQSSSLELLPSRFPFQPRANPEHYAAEGGATTLRRPRRQHSQPPVTSEFKEDVSPGSPRASKEQSILTEPMPSKYAPQPWLGPEFEPPASSLEDVAKKEDVLREAWLSGHPSQTHLKHNVEQTPSSFERTSVDESIPWGPLTPKCPTSLSIGSKVQEVPSHLQSAQDSSKKQKNSRSSPQSFVKFMAQQVFSDSSASETDNCAKPTTRGRSRPSRSLLKPKLDEHIFLYNWEDESKEDTTLKNLPMKQPFQSSRRPEEPQERLPLSEGASVKWSTSAREASQALGKLEYKQKVSVSVSFPDEWKGSEGQRPSIPPSQVLNVAELQPPIFSADSANVPVEWRIPEGHPPPGQSSMITDCQQQVYVSSANAAAEGAIPEKNTGCWPMPKGPASTKNVKYRQGYRDFTKSTPTSVTTPAKFASAPAQKKSFVSMGTYFKEEVPPCCDGRKSPSSLIPTRKFDVENVFGVRLRRTSQKIGMANPDPCKPLVPVSPASNKEQANKGALHGSGKSSPAFSFGEKQRNRPRYESTLKKSAVYRPPGKASSWKTDSSMEPTWITLAKHRQRGFASQFPKKSRTRSEIRAETKEPRFESKYDPELETLPKESEGITYIPSKMTSLSKISRHEMPQSRQFTKSVAFDDQKMLHTSTRERETRRSSSLPPKFLQPKEPEWFSVAKKKAQAWSHMADAMQ